MLSVKEGSHAVEKLLGEVPLKSMMKHDNKKDFSGKAEVVTVSSSDTVLDVINVLFKFHIASVPVIAPTEQTEDKTEKKDMVFDFWVESGTKKPGVVLGLVDMLDILMYIVSTLPPSQRLEPLEAEGRSLLENPIGNVINFSQKDKIVPLAQGHFVSEALPFFVKGTHRVMLFDDTKAISGLVSQSDFIRFLQSHFAKGEWKAMEKCNFDKNFRQLAPSVGILPTDSVYQAITKLGSAVLRTLPIIDANGFLVGNFSATDVGYAFAISKREGEELDKGDVFRTIFAHLHLTVQDYLTKFHPTSLTPQLCLPSITLEEACKTMVESNIKQLWVTDDIKNKVPIGVITQTDICRLFEQCSPICEQPCTLARG